ncbi:MAG: hypothetical protein KI785_02760 [Devosiaceae bacterium]|nr:hypothetical protein [Devosiaceae bacterium MH13]
MGHHKPSLKLVVSSHVRFDVAMSPKLQGPLTLTIGLALLKVLDQAQVRALFAHRYCLARAEGRKAGDVVTTQTLGRVRGVADGMAKRPSFLQLTKPSTLQAAAAEAEARWAQDTRSLYETADRDALMVCSGHELVGALLTEGLLAASNRERLERGDPQGPWLESIAMPWQPAARDAALRLLSAHQAPNPDSPNAGVGPALFERIARLGTDVPVPVLPSPTPAIDAFDPKAVQRMARAVIVGKPHKADAKPKKARKLKSKGKAEAADTVATADAAQPAEGTHPSLPSARPAKKSLFKKLTAKRRSGVEQQIDALPQAVAPLYEADALYRDDRHVGIEAYAALVHAHPRWSLARLRLGEAQVEAGFSDGVQNLLTCAETLPSALPTILERLGGAMAMVSPLDEETLRQTIDSLSQHAEAIAEERRGIDLDRLEPHALDTEDQACLRALFSASPGLREAWVFQLPVAGMPEVPHHAVIALAPTVETADAADVAQQITEHAAIIGTLVVHIETGRPTGALSDALAAHASFWRLASQ